MTLLRGHFAMTLICAGDAAGAEIEAALAPLTADGSLTVTVRAVPEEAAAATDGTPWVLTVHGGDRPGIVSSIVEEVARVGRQHHRPDDPADRRPLRAGRRDRPARRRRRRGRCEAAIKSVATALGVGATLRAAEADDL